MRALDLVATRVMKEAACSAKSTNWCLQDPYRDRRYPCCGKMGRSPDTCWTRDKTVCSGEGEDAKKNKVTFINRTRKNSLSKRDSSSCDDEYDRNGLKVILNREERDRKVLAVNRGLHGQPISKNPRTDPRYRLPSRQLIKPDVGRSKRNENQEKEN